MREISAERFEQLEGQVRLLRGLVMAMAVGIGGEYANQAAELRGLITSDSVKQERSPAGRGKPRAPALIGRFAMKSRR
jgi:hypothetical protein